MLKKQVCGWRIASQSCSERKKKYLFDACMWSVFKEIEYLDKCPSAQNLVAGADSSKTAGVHTNKLH